MRGSSFQYLEGVFPLNQLSSHSEDDFFFRTRQLRVSPAPARRLDLDGWVKQPHLSDREDAAHARLRTGGGSQRSQDGACFF